MPAKSTKQRMLMAIAKHHPDMVRPENKGVLKMTKSQQHDFASTDEKGLPVKVKKETKKTTTVKHEEGGQRAKRGASGAASKGASPTIDKGQRKQIKELTT